MALQTQATAIVSPPKVTLLRDTNNDGYINAAEKGTATTTNVEVAFDVTAAQVGDMITIYSSVAGQAAMSIALTQVEIYAGKVTFTNVALPVEGQTLTIQATYKDIAGNSALATGSAWIDTTISALSVVIALDTNNDGILNAGEKGIATTTSVDVGFDASKVKLGDIITLTSNTSQMVAGHVLTGVQILGLSLTQAMINAGKATFKDVPLPVEGGTLTSTATITDAAGNTETAKDSVTMNTALDVSLVVTIVLDTNNDGIINAAEKGTATTTSVDVGFDASKVKVGDIITLTKNNNPVPMNIALTQAMIDAGKATFVGVTLPAEGQALTVTATFTDSTGHTSSAQDSATIKAAIDVSLAVTITRDTNNDGIINVKEKGTATTTNVDVSFDATKVKVGNVITLVSSTGQTLVGKTLTAAMITAGKVTFTGVTLPAEGQTLITTATFKDSNGFSATAQDTATIDAAISPLTVAIALDTNNDGFINATEKGAATSTSVNVGFDVAKVKVGDVITLTSSTKQVIPSITLDNTMIAAGKVTFTYVNLPAEGATLTTTAVISDSAGNTATAKDTATVNALIPGGSTFVATILLDANKDGFINAVELGAATTTGVDVSFDKTKVKAGDVIGLTSNTGQIISSITLTTAMIATGKVTFTDVTLVGESETLTVTATITRAGGSSASYQTSAVIDTRIADITATITRDVNNDGYISAVEKGGVNTTNVDVGFDSNAIVVGDIITLTSNITGQPVASHTIIDADVQAGKVTFVGIPLPAEGQLLRVVAKIRDIAGNFKSSFDSATLDTLIPGGNGDNSLAVTIVLDTNNDGTISVAEKGAVNTTAVEVTFDKTKANAFDIITLASNTLGSSANPVLADIILTQAMVDAGKVTFTGVTLPAGGETLVTTATITDAAGNTASAQDTALIEKNPILVTSVVPLLSNIEGNAIPSSLDTQHWVAWQVNVSAASPTTTDLVLNINDAQHQARFGQDYSGVFEIWNAAEDTKLADVVLNAANNWTAHFALPAGATSVDVWAALKDDNIVEGDATISINVAASGQQDYVHSGNDIIVDDDIPVLSVSNSSVTEGGVLSFAVTMASRTNTTHDFSFALVNGTASAADYGAPTFTNGVTFNAATGKITIPAGVLNFAVNLPTVDDAIIENAETVQLVIGGGFSNASDVQGTGTIVDNDVASVTSVSSPTVTEGGVLSYAVTISGATIVATDFSFALGGGTASATDYGTPTFTNGVTFNAATGKITVPAGVLSFAVNLPTVDDAIVESNETVPLAVGGVQGTGTIIDNDAPVLSVSSPSVIEGGILRFTVTMAKTTTAANEFSFALGGGTASAADYSTRTFTNGVTYSAATGKITIPAGVLSFVVNVQTVNDAIVESSETVPLVVGGVRGTGTILDNDVPVASISSPTVTEGDVLSYTVTMSRATVVAHNFSFALGNGTASADDYGTPTFTNGVTYNATTGNITIPAGVLSFAVNLPTVDDAIVEGDETVLLTIGGGFTNASSVQGTGTIVDNDVALVTSVVAFRNDTEAGGWVGWHVNLSAASNSTTDLVFTTNDGQHQATFGEDYSGLYHVHATDGTYLGDVVLNADNGWTANFALPAGYTTVDIYAQLIDDNTVEGDETISINAAVNGAQDFVHSTDAIIIDDDIPVASISSPSVTEGGVLSYTVTMASTTVAAHDFSFTLGGGTASTSDYGAPTFTNGVTYNAATGSITIPAGVISFAVNVPTVNDLIIESNETVPLTIGGGFSNANSVSGTGTIIDNDFAVVTSVVAFRNDTEGGWAGWHVNLSAASSSTTDLVFSTNDGQHQATFGQDYSGLYHVHATDGTYLGDVVLNAANGYTGHFALPAGYTTVDIYAQLLDDTIVEGDETISINAAINGKQGFVHSTNATIIDNDFAVINLVGQAKGTEDTPLALTWASFGNPAGTAVAISSAPALGALQFYNGAWNNLAVGQNITKAEVDAGHLRFVPGANESGEAQYNAAGVGNKLNDYAAFDFKISNAGGNMVGSGHYTVDIAPVADDFTAGFITKGAVGGAAFVSSYNYNDPLTNNGTEMTYHRRYYSWESLPVSATPSPDTDGSERIMIKITGVPMLMVGNTVVSTLGSSGNYIDADGTSWARGGTSDYYMDSSGAYWVNNKIIGSVAIPASVVTTDGFLGNYGTSGLHAHTIITVTTTGFNISVTAYNQEVNSAGTVLDQKVIALGAHQSVASGQTHDDYWWTPLTLDLNDDGVKTLSVNAGVQFDIAGNGGKANTGWVDKTDGLLAIDLNHNGKIDSGAELLGEATKLADGTTAKDGFQALAQYDTNHDNVIDAKDAVFADLRVWTDSNSNGVTDEGELHSMADLKIASFNLTAQSSTAVDNGNLLGLVSSYTTTDGAVHQLVDVWFATSATDNLTQALASLPATSAPQTLTPASTEQSTVQVTPIAATH